MKLSPSLAALAVVICLPSALFADAYNDPKPHYSLRMRGGAIDQTGYDETASAGITIQRNRRGHGEIFGSLFRIEADAMLDLESREILRGQAAVEYLVGISGGKGYEAAIIGPAVRFRSTRDNALHRDNENLLGVGAGGELEAQFMEASFRALLEAGSAKNSLEPDAPKYFVLQLRGEGEGAVCYPTSDRGAVCLKLGAAAHAGFLQAGLEGNIGAHYKHKLSDGYRFMGNEVRIGAEAGGSLASDRGDDNGEGRGMFGIEIR